MTTPKPAVLLSVDGAVARIRFNRPERLNAMDMELVLAFGEAVDAVLADDRVRVIVVSAEGRAFIAGGDLTYFDRASDRAAASHAPINPLHRTLKALAGSPKLTVGSLKGAVAGGGMSLGGALALGHPLGATGGRLVGKASHLLKRENKKRALATQCIDGGMGIAMILEAA